MQDVGNGHALKKGMKPNLRTIDHLPSNICAKKIWCWFRFCFAQTEIFPFRPGAPASASAAFSFSHIRSESFLSANFLQKKVPRSSLEMITVIFRERKKATMETAETRKARLQCDSGKVLLITQLNKLNFQGFLFWDRRRVWWERKQRKSSHFGSEKIGRLLEDLSSDWQIQVQNLNISNFVCFQTPVNPNNFQPSFHF